MALLPVRKSATNELAGLHRQMDELFNSFFGDWPSTTYEKNVWPAIDVTDNDNEIIVKAEVPGCNAENIDISVHGNTLTISGEKKHEHEKKEKDYYYTERSYGSFRRQIALPSDVETEKIDAACKNGVLTLTLPKQEKAKTVKVKVKGQ
jgi:HSP20 family protein